MCQMCVALLPESDSCCLEPTEPGGAVSAMAYMATDLDEGSDASANSGTAYALEVGELFGGSISNGSDQDWIAIDLVAGQSYVFSVWGTGGYYNGLADTTLSLVTSSGSVLASNDNITGSNKFSLIEYTASSSGTFYLNVGGAGSSDGDYILQAATDVFTVDQVVTQISEFGWGASTVIRHDNVTTDSGAITVNITALNSAGQNLAQWALDAWATSTGLEFQYVTSGGDIRFDDNSSGAFGGPTGGYYPTNGNIIYSTVNVHSSWITSYGGTIDSYTYQTYLHEIGHALGLTHSGNYNGSGSFGTDNHFLNDSTQMTVMSYFDLHENTWIGADRGTAITPMIADVAAIWEMYGTPTAGINDGNTVWGANSNVGGVLGDVMGILFDGNAYSTSFYDGDHVAFTIVDTGGHDLIDLSTVTGATVLDLRAGGIGGFNGRSGNLVMAMGTQIEDAATGDGNDEIIGNGAANDIDAGAGDDTITGGAGDDTISGGAGTDTAIIGDALASVTVTDLGGGSVRIAGLDGTDDYHGVEFFDFTDGTASLATVLARAPGGGEGGGGGGGSGALVGTAGDDYLVGTAGNDTIDGGGGHDTIDGAGGYDSMLGGDGDDYISGLGGFDTMRGGEGNDTLLGNYGNDMLFGDGGDDVINAGFGFDYVDGGSGADDVTSLNGFDTVFGGAGDDTIRGNAGNDELHGGADNDLIDGGIGADTIYGDDGNDNIYGKSGADFVSGGAGDDTVRGNHGNDTISGGTGTDILQGGMGADTFLFMLGDGADTIVDMGLADNLRLDGALLDGQDAEAYLTQVGGNWALDFGGGDMLIFSGLGNSNWIFDGLEVV